MRLVKLEAPVKTKHGDNQIEAVVEVPQYESIAELVQAGGGEEKVLAYFNKKVEQSAKAAATQIGPRESNTATPEQIVAKMQEAASTYNFAVARGRGTSSTTNKAKAESFDRLADIILKGNFSQEELLAALNGIK